MKSQNVNIYYFYQSFMQYNAQTVNIHYQLQNKKNHSI